MRYSIKSRILSIILALLLTVSVVCVSGISTVAAENDVTSIGATDFYLAGDMNSWSTTATPMTKATDKSGTTIYYAGPYTTQYQFKVVSAGGTWYGSEIKTKDLYDTSLEMYEYGSTGNCWPAAASSYYVVFTTSAGGNAISCVTKLPIVEPVLGGFKPTVYIKDATNSGCALWGWTAEDVNLFSGTWETRPTTSGKTVNADGYYEFKADTAIGEGKQYSIKVTKGTSTTATDSWFETIAHGNLWVTIAQDGSIEYSAQNPVQDTRTKANAFSNGLWVDPQPSVEGLSTLIRWYQKSASEYHLYLPSGLNFASVKVYHSYNSLKIQNLPITSGTNVALSPGSTYTLSGDVSGSLKVFQSKNVHTMYLNTLSDLPDEKSSSLVSKGNICVESGSVYCTDSTGANVFTDSIKKIKGRGNSSWEASYQLFGKYAFNLTLKNKTKDLVGGKVKTKKYSMLANNADESMLRNKLIYDLAAKIGLDYSPTIRIYDVYNNGRYLGSYTICEKVEVGSSGLLNGVDSLDDANAEVNPDVEDAPQKESGTRGTPGYYRYVDSTDPEDITGGYLLEFELSERFYDEVSGFISNKGQCVVIKYPEFATKNEVLYIKNLFNKAEDAAYASSPDINTISKYIDAESFAKMYLVQEISKNIDAAQTSYYIYKETDSVGDGKLHASPVWDYDWTCGQYAQERPVVSGTDSTGKLDTATGWTTRYRCIDNSTTKGANFQAKLCACTGFWNLVKSVWYTNFKDNMLTFVFDDSQYTLTNSPAIISEYYSTYKDSINMNEKHYGFIAGDQSASWGTKDTGDTLSDTVNYLNNWLFDRTTWMNSKIGTKATATKPTLTTTIKDSKKTLALTGTKENPELVSSDVMVSAVASSGAITDITVNGKKASFNAKDKVCTIAVEDEGVTEIKVKVLAHAPAVASTDSSYVATQEYSFVVAKAPAKTLYYGDTNLNGDVEIIDVTLTQRYLAHIDDKLSADAILCADADGNGDVNIIDCTNTQRYLAHLSCSNKVGTVI
ncbi:MAG: CotH kinase family protein [Oscillospiraceae bacterium]|nr:CotH kinase family protein [Candidatus Ruminococcus equi]